MVFDEGIIDENKLDFKLFQKLVLYLLPKLITETPVDTGRTRASWNIIHEGKFKYSIINKNGLVAAFLDLGYDSYDIKPKNKKYLKWRVKIAPQLNKSQMKAIAKNGFFIMPTKDKQHKWGYSKEGSRWFFLYNGTVKHPGFAGTKFITNTFNDIGLFDKIVSFSSNPLLSIVKSVVFTPYIMGLK